MDIGLLFPFRNPPQWRKPFPQFYAEQLRQMQVAEALGHDTVWLTEHHFAEDGYSPSLSVACVGVDRNLAGGGRYGCTDNCALSM